jgi:hypothetical protein
VLPLPTSIHKIVALKHHLRSLEVRFGTPPPPRAFYLVNTHQVTPRVPTSNELESLRPKLGWAPVDIIKKTLSATTQYAKQIVRSGGMRQHYRTRFPALNVHRQNESVSTDTILADTPAVGSGA